MILHYSSAQNYLKVLDSINMEYVGDGILVDQFYLNIRFQETVTANTTKGVEMSFRWNARRMQRSCKRPGISPEWMPKYSKHGC
jgi:hypothetical protein